ncbi:MAG: hypothetical protein V1932_05340, partial [Chloroflexota bacterium]
PPEMARSARESYPGFDRRAALRMMMENHALEHSERMREVLEKVPASARPALLRAITVSEAGYSKAIGSFD